MAPVSSRSLVPTVPAPLARGSPSLARGKRLIGETPEPLLRPCGTHIEARAQVACRVHAAAPFLALVVTPETALQRPSRHFESPRAAISEGVRHLRRFRPRQGRACPRGARRTR